MSLLSPPTRARDQLGLLGELSVGRPSSVADSTDSDHRAVPFVLLCSPLLHSPLSFRSLPPPLHQADAMLAAFNIKTIEDLGKWRFYLTARAIATLAKTGQSQGGGGRDSEGTRWQRDARVARARAPISSPNAANRDQRVQPISQSVSQLIR